MIILPDFNGLSAALPGLAACFAAGLVLGVGYFLLVGWNAHLFAAGGRLKLAVALIVGRFAAMAGLLAWLSLHGAPALLVAMLGILAGRFLVMRRLRRALA